MRNREMVPQAGLPADALRVKDSIAVCICTYQRTHLLPRLFEKISLQKTEDRFDITIAIVDNDKKAPARIMVSELESRFNVKTSYTVEPARNFAVVRNRVVRLSTGNFIAFIDDDEVPVEDWLYHLWLFSNQCNADGVLGPVRPYFENTPPDWLVRSGLCNRPSHTSGMILNWEQTRTGNTLLRRSIFDECGVWFDPYYATGGEDKDFFKRAEAAGCKFVWCEEAPAYELVPVERQSKSYYLKRALLQGAISAKYDRSGTDDIHRTLKLCAKTLVAAVIYTLLMPLFSLRGMHVLMKYMVKDCHHISRLFAMIGVPLIKQRNF
jgi:succinoglycan biosynthesis protein ExoM